LNAMTVRTKTKPRVERDENALTDSVRRMFIFIYTIILDVVSLIFWGINIIILAIILVFKTVASLLHVVLVYIPRLTGRFVPAGVSMRLDQVLVYGGVNLTAEEVIGMTGVYSLVISIVAFLIAHALGLSVAGSVLASVMSFIGAWIFPKLLLDALVYKRTQSIEGVLPDILDIIAQNIRVGMTTDRALWSAARPEFGPLASELQMAARATLTGTPLPDALIGITNRIKSERLERTIRLIIQGITSGGELPAILQTIAIDMRSEQNLIKQMRAETNAHALFIQFAILFGAPLLFAVSLQFIIVFSTLFSKLDVSQLSNMPHGASVLSLQPFVIDQAFYFKYAIVTIIVLCIFGSFLVGILRTGKGISGIQNIIPMVLIAMAVFLVLNYVMTNVFAGAFAM
jgi:hypothetical protein